MAKNQCNTVAFVLRGTVHGSKQQRTCSNEPWGISAKRKMGIWRKKTTYQLEKGLREPADEAKMREIRCFLWMPLRPKETVDSVVHEEQLYLKLGKYQKFVTVDGTRSPLEHVFYLRQDLGANIASAPLQHCAKTPGRFQSSRQEEASIGKKGHFLKGLNHRH